MPGAQFVLAPKPSSAYFLKPAERTWLAARQDRLQAAFNSKHSRQGNWWASIPDWCAPPQPPLMPPAPQRSVTTAQMCLRAVYGVNDLEGDVCASCMC